MIGGGAESFSATGVRFRKLNSDLFRATLGFDAGDLEATTNDGTKLELFNVIFVVARCKLSRS